VDHGLEGKNSEASSREAGSRAWNIPRRTKKMLGTIMSLRKRCSKKRDENCYRRHKKPYGEGFATYEVEENVKKRGLEERSRAGGRGRSHAGGNWGSSIRSRAREVTSVGDN